MTTLSTSNVTIHINQQYDHPYQPYDHTYRSAIGENVSFHTNTGELNYSTQTKIIGMKAVNRSHSHSTRDRHSNNVDRLVQRSPDLQNDNISIQMYTVVRKMQEIYYRTCSKCATFQLVYSGSCWHTDDM